MIVGVAGFAFTVTTVAAEVAVQPAALSMSLEVAAPLGLAVAEEELVEPQF